MTPAIRFGADRLVANPALLGEVRRVGLVTNDAARLATDARVHTRVALRAAGIPIVRLFGPEHGLGAVAADGAAVEDGVDPMTGLPVVSLYGAQMRPTRESVKDLDVMLFDIPDVGARFYTYIWTLFHVLEACAEYGVPVVVLDRPNPLGGALSRAEGPVLDLAHRSFIGDDAIPIRHSLTAGELAQLWRHERFPAAAVRVIPIDGWTRAMTWPALGLPWVPTSPSMPSYESAGLYPGVCLFEATNLSVGRGTPTPFQVIGAPWLHADAVRRAMAARASVALDPCEFTPSLGPHAGTRCAGLRVRCSDDGCVAPVALGLLLLAAVIETHHAQFRWADYPTAANPTGGGHFERLVGVSGIRAVLEASPETVDAALVRRWTEAGAWRDRVGDGGALIYPM